MVIRKTLLCIASGLLALTVRAQVADTGPAVPAIIGSFRNPSLLETEGRPWVMNIVRVRGWANSGTASIHVGDIGKSPADFLRSDILGTSSISTGTGGLDIMGPSVAFRAGRRLTVGFSTRMRIHANYGHVDGRLLSEIGEVTKVEQSYPYRLPQIARMQTSIAAFTELGATFSYELARNENHRLNVGGTLKYINGVAHTSIEVSELTGLIRLNSDRVSFITGATGSVTTLTAGKLFDRFSPGNLAKPRKAGAGADLGFTYSYYASAGQPWKFRLGVSVTDIGKIHYKADSAFSKSYKIEIESDERLYFNHSFNNSLFSRTSRVFDSYPKFFERTASSDGDYTVALPTMLHVQADYRFSPQWLMNAAAGLSLNAKNDTYKLYQVPYVTLSPAWVKGKAIVSVPLAYQEYAGFTAGAALRYKGFTVGSNSLLSAIAGGRQLDFYFGFSIFSGK